MRTSRRQQGLFQKKSLGQVFLREEWPCRKMVENLVRFDVSHVIEIGPGLGILTRALLSAGINVTAVEKDSRFAERLEGSLADLGLPGRLKVVNQDVLKYPIDDWLNSTSGHKAICGNVPYNISSAILFKTLEHLDALRAACLMFQLEFCERVVAKPSTKAYGSLSIFVQLRANGRIEYQVPRTCFDPRPKVDSAVVSLAPAKWKHPQELLEKVERVSKKAFSQRRKKLSNSLSSFISDSSSLPLPVALSRRCETLSPEEFVALAKSLDLGEL